jgi:signal transduction histidine kinase
MSHDLRTPLNSILGFLGILSTDTTRNLAAERFQEYGQNIHIAADSLLTLVNDLLDLSRIEAGQFPIHPEEFVLGPLVEETANSSAPVSKPETSGSTVRLRDVTVASDRRAISQILSNLLSNGLKYTDPAGHVSVTLVAATATDRAQIIVSDTGRGIPPDDLLLIFEPYFRGSADIARDISGTGLGLPICKRPAELIDADLQIDSEVSVGTSVSLSLPPDIPPQADAAR